jgi:hypothetical protein
MVAALVLAVSLPFIPTDACGPADFGHQVSHYMRLRTQAAAGLPPERTFADPAEMLKARTALRAAIGAARPHARPGDILGGCSAHMLRRIVIVALAGSQLDPVELVRRLNADRYSGAKRPVVNGKFDWRLGAWMWPALLRDLPRLPDPLEYRIVDDDLVLVDVGASLVVDILDDALDVDGD